MDEAIYIVVLVYALCQPVVLPFPVCELCLPVVSSTHLYIFLISARNLFKVLVCVLFQLASVSVMHAAHVLAV